MRTYTNNSANSKGHIQLLVIGSSIIRDVQASRIEQNSPALTMCIPGARIEDLPRTIFDIKEHCFIKNIILHAGGNNINDHTIRDPQFLSHATIATLENIRRRMPIVLLYGW